jgi:hypothetical protein
VVGNGIGVDDDHCIGAGRRSEDLVHRPSQSPTLAWGVGIDSNHHLSPGRGRLGGSVV